MALADQPRILVVNHSADVALLLKLAVQDAFPNAVVVTATAGAESERRLHAGPVDVVLLAIGDSLAESRLLAKHIQGLAPASPRLVLMGNRPDLPQLAAELGASGWLRRPPSQSELEAALRRLLTGTGEIATREDVLPPDAAERDVEADTRR